MAYYSTVTFSELNRERIDPEYYEKSFIANEVILKKLKTKSITSVSHVFSGIAYPSKLFSANSGVPVSKITDVNQETDITEWIQISKSNFDKLKSKAILDADILFCATHHNPWDLGKVRQFYGIEKLLTFNQRVFLFRSKVSPCFNDFLFAFLQTKIARKQIERWGRGNNQLNLNNYELSKIQIPIFEENEIVGVSELIKNHHIKQKLSKSLYAQAQELLEKELGLDQLFFRKKLYSVSTFEDVINGHRLDAQHFQFKFDILLDHIQKYPFQTVRKIRTLNRRGLQPKYIENGAISVVNSQHITSTHLAYNNFEKTSVAEFEKAKEAHIQKDDVLIYTTGAYIGQTNLYDSQQPAMASNHVNILRVNGVDSGYLSIVLQSVIGKFQTEKHSRGSAQAELYPSDIDKFIVPLIDTEKQKTIGDLLRESLNAKQESERLLIQAKKQVEDLIEGAAQ